MCLSCCLSLPCSVEAAFCVLALTRPVETVLRVLVSSVFLYQVSVCQVSCPCAKHPSSLSLVLICQVSLYLNSCLSSCSCHLGLDCVSGLISPSSSCVSSCCAVWTGLPTQLTVTGGSWNALPTFTLFLMGSNCSVLNLICTLPTF